MKMHDDQIDVPDAVAAELIADQFPQWSHDPIRRVASGGTVNSIFRIGDHSTARFPLRASDPETTRLWLEEEAHAAAEFAACSPVPAPVPLGIGRPGAGYPLFWSVQTWIAGVVFSECDFSESETFARDLVTLVRALRAADTRGRPFDGVGRGGDMTVHDEFIRASIRRCATFTDVTGWDDLWATFCALPRTAPNVMSHRDLIPGNVLVNDGRLVGVLDGGGFSPADPAIDVIAGWHLLARGPRALFRDALECDDVEWERSRGWAFQQAVGAAGYYAETNPAMFAMGERTLQRVLEDRE